MKKFSEFIFEKEEIVENKELQTDIIKELEDSEEISEELFNKIVDNFDIEIVAEDTKESIMEKLK